MRDEYDIEKLNPRKNPYTKQLKKQITININNDTIEFFKAKAADSGFPYVNGKSGVPVNSPALVR